MNIEVTVKDWTDALRGLGARKYEQVSECLRRADRFCCLGVLCDVVDSTRWCPETNLFIFEGENDLLLPISIRKHFGLSWESQNALTEYNDDGRHSFKEIADIIDTATIDGKIGNIVYFPK